MEIPTGRFTRRRRWLPPPATALGALEALTAESAAQRAWRRPATRSRNASSLRDARTTGLNQAVVDQGSLPSDATGRHRPRGCDLVDLTAMVQVSFPAAAFPGCPTQGSAG